MVSQWKAKNLAEKRKHKSSIGKSKRRIGFWKRKTQPDFPQLQCCK